MKRLLVCLVLLVVLVGCRAESEDRSPGLPRERLNMPTASVDLYEYEYNGMPCIIADGWRRFALTCDWSKWETDSDDEG